MDSVKREASRTKKCIAAVPADKTDYNRTSVQIARWKLIRHIAAAEKKGRLDYSY